jgi:hypothetical protein
MKFKKALVHLSLAIGLVFAVSACRQANDVASSPDYGSQTPATFSETAKIFVDKNYPGYLISAISSDSLHEGDSVVMITKQDKPKLSLIFESNGTFLQQEEDMSFASLPEALQQTLARQYVSFIASDPLQKVTLSDSTTQYDIAITTENSTKQVHLASSGKVISER